MRGPDHCLRIGSRQEQGGVTNNNSAWDDDNDDDDEDDDDDDDANDTIHSDLGNITRSVDVRLFSPLRLHCLGNVNQTATTPNTRRRQTRLTNGNKRAGKGSDKKHLNVARASDAFTWTKDGNIVTWRRDLVMLQGEFIEFREVTYHDIGIYTCLYASTAKGQLVESMQVLSKFKLNVHSPPIVRIFPPTQFHTPGDTIQLQCHVISDPSPSISWHINEEALNLSLTKYQLSNGNRTLEIFGASHKIDTGAYKCLASSNYETSQDIATVFVEDTNMEGYNQESLQGEEFMLLTRSGVKVVDPTLCRLQPISFRLSSQLLLHHSFQYSRNKKNFQWESVVNVKSRFVFASLKKTGVIFRMDASAFTFSPVEKINIGNCTPTRLRYLVNFDEVWGECIAAAHATGKDGKDGDGDDDDDEVGNSNDDDDDEDADDDHDKILSTIVVIKNASTEAGHKVHFIDLEFEMVRKIFIPPINDLNFTWSFAFLSTTTNNKSNNNNNINKLFLFNLTSKRLTNRPPVDLSSFRCTTENVHHVVFGGKVIIECAEDAGRKRESRKFHYLQLDLTTQHLEILPLPQSRGYHLSPDSKLLTGISSDLTCLIVYRVTPEGTLEEVTNTAVMDWLLRETIFIGSPLGSYDIAVECLSNQELLKYDVRERRVDILNKKSKQKTNQDLRRKNHFQSSGVLRNYIMTSHGTDELVLLDAWNNSEKCSWKKVIVDFALWIDPVHF